MLSSVVDYKIQYLLKYEPCKIYTGQELDEDA